MASPRRRLRRMRTAHAIVCLVLALGGSSVDAQKADGPSQLSREWKRLATPSLTVVGNAREDDLRRAGLEIERFRRAIGSLSSALRMDSPVPTTVVVFRDDSALSPFKPRVRGKVNDNVAGYFSARPDVNYIVMAPSERREFTLRLIFHEYTHYLVNRNFKRLPLWLNEGLADFYSTFSGSDKDERTIVGRPIDYYVATLLSRPMMPLAKFVSPAAAAELYKDVRGTQLLYSQSWALTHYLLAGNQGARQPQLVRFINAIDSGTPMDKAFVDVFGPDLAVVDRELRAYVRQFRLPAILLSKESLALDLEATRMREVDALQIQGDLLVNMGAFELAEKYLTKALTLDPTFAPARLSRAMQRLMEDRHDDALDIASAPDLMASSDFRAHFVYAEALRADEQHDAAIAAYRRAIALHPEAAHAYYGLSLAQLAKGDAGAAASFTMCVTISPGPGWYSARQREAMRLGLDRFIVSDATNYVRLAGWQDDSGTYVMLPAAIAYLRAGARDHALEVLADIERHVEAESWQASVAALMRGTLAPDALIAKAKRDDGLLTEAHAYIGILASIGGRREEALRHLEWVKASGRKDYIEYGFALGELRRLERGATPK